MNDDEIFARRMRERRGDPAPVRVHTDADYEWAIDSAADWLQRGNPTIFDAYVALVVPDHETARRALKDVAARASANGVSVVATNGEVVNRVRHMSIRVRHVSIRVAYQLEQLVGVVLDDIIAYGECKFAADLLPQARRR